VAALSDGATDWKVAVSIRLGIFRISLTILPAWD
jgi:hypothetical protein